MRKLCLRPIYQFLLFFFIIYKINLFGTILQSSCEGRTSACLLLCVLHTHTHRFSSILQKKLSFLVAFVLRRCFLVLSYYCSTNQFLSFLSENDFLWFFCLFLLNKQKCERVLVGWLNLVRSTHTLKKITHNFVAAKVKQDCAFQFV